MNGIRLYYSLIIKAYRLFNWKYGQQLKWLISRTKLTGRKLIVCVVFVGQRHLKKIMSADHFIKPTKKAFETIWTANTCSDVNDTET